MKREVFCTYQREGFHCWPQAPEEVGFLTYPHRHKFFFKGFAKVTHNDRDKEFILLQRKLAEVVNYILSAGFPNNDHSCEAIGEGILNHMPELYKVEVSEDNENGAIIERD